MSKDIITIYDLADESGNVFYVGCTTQRIDKRVANHIYEAKSGESFGHPTAKDKRIIDLGFNIVSTVLDVFEPHPNDFISTKAKALEVEREWIKWYLSLGYDLVNVKGVNDKVEMQTTIGLTIKVENGKIV